MTTSSSAVAVGLKVREVGMLEGDPSSVEADQHSGRLVQLATANAMALRRTK